MDPYVGDTCLIDYATTHTILRDKKYFLNLTLVQANVNTIIQGSGRATIFLPHGTQFQIIDALYSDTSNINLLIFKDIR